MFRRQKTKHCLSMSSASSLLSTSAMIESLLEGSVPAKLFPDEVDLYDRRVCVCVLPRATPNVVYDPPSEAFHSHIVDRIVHPSAFSQCSATTAHNSFKKVFCWIGSKTCDNKTPLPLFNKGRPSGIPLCAKTVLMRDWFCRKKTYITRSNMCHIARCAMPHCLGKRVHLPSVRDKKYRVSPKNSPYGDHSIPIGI